MFSILFARNDTNSSCSNSKFQINRKFKSLFWNLQIFVLTALAQAFQVWHLSNDETFEIQLGVWLKYRYFPDEGFVKFFGVLRCIVSHIVLGSIQILFVNYGKVSVFTFERQFYTLRHMGLECVKNNQASPSPQVTYPGMPYFLESIDLSATCY